MPPLPSEAGLPAAAALLSAVVAVTENQLQSAVKPAPKAENRAVIYRFGKRTMKRAEKALYTKGCIA